MGKKGNFPPQIVGENTSNFPPREHLSYNEVPPAKISCRGQEYKAGILRRREVRGKRQMRTAGLYFYTHTFVGHKFFAIKLLVFRKFAEADLLFSFIS